MKTLTTYINENQHINEAETPFKEGDAYLIQYNFKNAWKDSQLSKMVYVPDLEYIDPKMCNQRCEPIKIDIKSYYPNSVRKISDDVQRLSVQEEHYASLLDDMIDDINKSVSGDDNPCYSDWDSDHIVFTLPIVKVVTLTKNEHLPAVTSLVYFDGKWDNLINVRRYLKTYCKKYFEDFRKKAEKLKID